MKLIFKNLKNGVILILLTFSVLDSYSQTTIYDSKGFEFPIIQGAAGIVLSKRATDTTDYWVVNDDSVQDYYERCRDSVVVIDGSYIQDNYIYEEDSLRNSWSVLYGYSGDVLSNSAATDYYSIPTTGTTMSHSLGLCALWGPQSLAFWQQWYDCLGDYQQLTMSGTFNYFYDLPTDRWAYRMIPTTNYTTLSLTFQWRCGGDAKSNHGMVGYSLNNGKTWTWIASGGTGNTGIYWGDNGHALSANQSSTIALPAICNNQDSLAIGFRFVVSGKDSTSSGSTFIIDNLKLTGTKNTTVPTCATYTLPANAATGVSQSPVLTWDAVSTATSYNVYLGTTNPPTTEVSKNQTGTSYTASGLLANTKYYWEIIPVNGAGDATGCSIWSFTTVSAPTCATYTAPANAATGVSQSTVLTWDAVGTATSYNVYLGTTDPPSTEVSVNQTGTTYTTSGLLVGTKYYWEVVPVNGAGSATGCSVWSFTTVLVCSPPAILASANNVTSLYAVCPRSTTTVIALSTGTATGSGCSGNWQYSWSDGSKYWNGTAFAALTPVWNEAYNNISISSSDSIKYSVQVECSNSATCTASSAVTVVVLSDPNSVIASIGTPANGLNNHMNVTWSKVAGADYLLQFSKNNTNWSTIYTGSKTALDHNTGSYPNQPCFYRIQSYNGTDSCGIWTYPVLDTAYTACDFPVIIAQNPTSSSIDVVFNNDNNPAYTLYSLTCLTTNQFVQANGTLGPTAVYLTKAGWKGTVTVNGLASSTKYCFYASAKNKQGNVQTQGPGTTVCISTSACVAPLIVSQTSGTVNKCAGDSIAFKVHATGGGTLSYQWEKETTAITGATKSIYVMSNLNITNEDYYNCVLTDACGSTTSANAIVYVYTKPVLNISALVQRVQTGDTVKYTLAPTGAETFTYQWILNGNPIPGATKNTYIIDGITSNQGGIYSCDVSDFCGSVTQVISTIIINSNNALYGLVSYDNIALTPLDKVIVNIQNTEKTFTDADTTDITGNYLFSPINNDNYIFNCSTSLAWGGGNPLDALIVNRYFIGIVKSFADDLKKAAADVNADGQITPLDALLINRRFIGVVKSFKAGDWVFANDTVMINSDTKNSIKGVCYGDVLGDYKNIPTRSVPDINYITNNQQLTTNNDQLFLDVPVSLTSDQDIAAIGLKFNVQTSKFKVVDVISNIDGLIYNIEGNSVAIAWSALNKSLNLKQGDVLFKLRLQITDNHDQLSANNYQLSNDIISDPVSLIADDKAQRLSGVKLSIPSLTTNNDQLTTKIYPNPFNNSTTIEYNLPQSEVGTDNYLTVHLRIYNMLGILISEPVNTLQNAGVYKVNFDGSALPSGPYFYSLEAMSANHTYSQTKMMLLSK